LNHVEEEIVTEFSYSHYDYTAFEKWHYKAIIYEEQHEQVWTDFGESFYRASEALVDGVVKRAYSEDIEGVAALFLFRHYLELALKRIIVRGRCLIRTDKNAAWEDVKQVAKIHELPALWKMVLSDARPKLELCVNEFGVRDTKGFSFRYPRHGGEKYKYDFEWFRSAMEHTYQVLEGITTYLIELHGQNEEFDAILRDEAGF
jgi:hypothetical protein